MTTRRMALENPSMERTSSGASRHLLQRRRDAKMLSLLLWRSWRAERAADEVAFQTKRMDVKRQFKEPPALHSMSTNFSKITSKNQTVVPREVRARLGLKPGDQLRYSVGAKGVLLEKVGSTHEEDAFAVFSEWSGDADEKAFGNL